TGRIDLVHCNNSRDEFGSSRDRHAAIESGTIDPAQLLDVVRTAGAPAVSDPPPPAADIAWLRAHLTDGRAPPRPGAGRTGPGRSPAPRPPGRRRRRHG